MNAGALPLASGLALLLGVVDQDVPEPDGRDGFGETVRGIRGLDPAEWQRFYLANRDDLFRYAHTRLGSIEEAEDSVSDAFEEALRSASRLEDRGLPPRAWLYGIIRNVINRRRRRFFQTPPQLSLDALNVSIDGQLEVRIDLLDLARLVTRLPARQAEVVMLRFVHGLSLEETAEVLSEKPNGVKARQVRALKRLRQWSDASKAATAEPGVSSPPLFEPDGESSDRIFSDG